MLPPTSAQGHQPQYNGQTNPSRPIIPPPSSFSGQRELLAPPTSRPESSMSISSMLGSDVGQTSKDNSTIQRHAVGSGINGSLSSPAHATKTVSSPTGRTIGPGLFRRRSPSPTDKKWIHGAVNRTFRAFSNDTQRQAPPTTRSGSPKAPSPNGSLGQPGIQQSPTAEHPSGQQWRFSHHHHSSGNRLGKRPTSQPISYGTPSQPTDSVHQPRSAASISDRYREMQVAQKYDQLAREAKEKFNYRPANRPSQEFLEEQIQKVRDERAAAIRKSPTSNHQPRPLPRPSVTTDFMNNRFRRDIENVDHVYNHDPQDVHQGTQSPFSPDYLRRSREERLAPNEPQPPTLSLSHSNSTHSRHSDHPEERQRQQFPTTHPTPLANINRSLSTNEIDHPKKAGEEIIIQQPRHSLSLLIENGRRGRISPLPQAVQGAQGRNSGPASDPGIKNEFGRMFSGIGSGVGCSGPMGSGTSTPFPTSPKGNHEPERRTPFTARGELFDLSRPREGSRLGKRGLGRDAELRMESENQPTPSFTETPGQRGVKRRHPHHHHPHNHR